MDNTVRQSDFTDDPVPRVLRLFYTDEALLTVASRPEGDGKVALDFRFPMYARARESMGHVSSVQITAAILEGGYAALEDALQSGLFPDDATPEWFYGTLADWLALRMNILFRRQVKEGELCSLNFRVLDIGTQRLRRRRLSATIEFDGFCSGETTWVIDPPPSMLV